MDRVELAIINTHWHYVRGEFTYVIFSKLLQLLNNFHSVDVNRKYGEKKKNSNNKREVATERKIKSILIYRQHFILSKCQ